MIPLTAYLIPTHSSLPKETTTDTMPEYIGYVFLIFLVVAIIGANYLDRK